MAMGLRNATVRKIALAGFDHDCLDTDDHWAGSRLFFCGRQQSAMATTSNVHSLDVRWTPSLGALLLRHSLALPLGAATVFTICGMVAFYGNPRLESGETISGKVRKDEHLAHLERSPARDFETEVSSPLGRPADSDFAGEEIITKPKACDNSQV